VINFTAATAPAPAGPPPCGNEQSIRLLAIQAVAALQNAATSVKYDYTVPIIKNSVMVGMNSTCFVVEFLKDKLDAANNQGCPL